nr:alpha/beta hydrolase [Dactylosporangium thailandense]
MYFVERGYGVPVLAVHGFTPDHRLMLGCLEPIFDRIPGYRRLYPDLPGMGRTPGDGIDSSDDVLAALDAFVTEHIGTEPFLLIGESYGGYLGRAVTSRRPDQVRGLALICSIGTAVEHAKRTVPEHATLRIDPDLDADPGFTEMAVVRTAAAYERFKAEVQPGLDAADEATLARILRRYALSTEPESGPPFTRPALILCGRQDSTTGYEDQYALLPHYPRATFAVLDVAGHNLQFEQPELFEALLTEWMTRTTTG